MASFVLVILFTVALRTSTCAGVRLPNYIPTLQDYSGRRNDIIENYFHHNDNDNDIIENYFHLGLEYSEILLFLGLFHGITLSLRQLKRLLKAKGLGRRRNPSDLDNHEPAGKTHQKNLI